MGTTFSRAAPEVYDRLGDVLRQHRPDLADAGVRFRVLLAENEAGDPLLIRRVACAAIVRTMPGRFREELGEVQLDLDADRWGRFTDGQRNALMHHEAMHVQLKRHGRDNEGLIYFDRDPYGLPAVRLRAADWNPTDGFASVIAAHGRDAFEYGAYIKAARGAEKALVGELPEGAAT